MMVASSKYRLSQSPAAQKKRAAGGQVAHSKALSSGESPIASEGYRFRRGFASRWQGYLRSRFSTIAAAAQAFDVDERTARDWWHGRCAPSGPSVAYAFRMTPAAAESHLTRLPGE